jgi:hypothetical protein
VSTYPIGLSALVKYPMAQYKLGVATTTSPHYVFVVNYEGYTITPSRYGSDFAKTTNNIACYDDVIMSHYKDNLFYIPNQ